MAQSDKVQIPVAHLTTVGRNLKNVKAELEAVENGMTSLSGVDDVHGARMSTAVESFFSEWKTSRRTLLDNVDGLGDVSSQIASSTSEFDGKLSSSLNEFASKLQGGGGSGGGAGARAGAATGGGAVDSSGDYYAFKRSTSQTSEKDIISTMTRMRSTLNLMLSSVAKLEPHWIAVEADGYYQAARKMNENAKGIVDILDSVEDSLKAVREGTDELRNSHWEVLSKSE